MKPQTWYSTHGDATKIAHSSGILNQMTLNAFHGRDLHQILAVRRGRSRRLWRGWRTKSQSCLLNVRQPTAATMMPKTMRRMRVRSSSRWLHERHADHAFVIFVFVRRRAAEAERGACSAPPSVRRTFSSAPETAEGEPPPPGAPAPCLRRRMSSFVRLCVQPARERVRRGHSARDASQSRRVRRFLREHARWFGNGGRSPFGATTDGDSAP